VLPWPDPVRQLDDHQLCAITVDAADDFLEAIGWPDSYSRSNASVQMNGPLKRGKELGYDLADHIRAFLVLMRYESFSVVDILMAVGYPGVGLFPLFFLSHVQAEAWTVTREGMLTGAWKHAGVVQSLLVHMLPFLSWFLEFRSCSVWVDYFVLRQKQKDSTTKGIKRVIAHIAYTCVLCAPLPCRVKPEAMTRIWCVFEFISTQRVEAPLVLINRGDIYSMLFPLAGNVFHVLQLLLDPAPLCAERDKQHEGGQAGTLAGPRQKRARRRCGAELEPARKNGGCSSD